MRRQWMILNKQGSNRDRTGIETPYSSPQSNAQFTSAPSRVLKKFKRFLGSQSLRVVPKLTRKFFTNKKYIITSAIYLLQARCDAKRGSTNQFKLRLYSVLREKSFQCASEWPSVAQASVLVYILSIIYYSNFCLYIYYIMANLNFVGFSMHYLEAIKFNHRFYN